MRKFLVSAKPVDHNSRALARAYRIEVVELPSYGTAEALNCDDRKTLGQTILQRLGQTMILLNFSHPLTAERLAQVEALTGCAIQRVIELPTQFDPAAPFGPQATALADACGLTPAEWQSASLLIVPPALNFITAVLLAELHGRCGHFPPCLRIRPVEGVSPPRYEVAELLDLQGQRDAARERRWQ